MSVEILSGQHRDGRWPSEVGEDALVGSTYTTYITAALPGQSNSKHLT
ncbi:MAG: hypothetical protein MK171_11070 [Pirellulales bacterium]|nr:hypothetical protein [Pirellulales bacterium]